jgi:hypothetical protein
LLKNGFLAKDVTSLFIVHHKNTFFLIII